MKHPNTRAAKEKARDRILDLYESMQSPAPPYFGPGATDESAVAESLANADWLGAMLSDLDDGYY